MRMMADAHKLTIEGQRALREMVPEMQTVARTIDALEAIGIDVSEQKDRLEKANTIRAGLLQHFGNPIIPK